MRFFAYMAFCLLLPCALVADDVADDDKTTPETAESDADGDVDAAADGGGLDAGFERFKTILDRMPFGRPPPGFDPDAPGGASGTGAGAGADGENAVEVSEVEQQILSSVRVSALNVTPAGVVTVGFTDSSVQPPRNYFMEVGEKRGEWTVVEADPDPEKKTVKLSKNGVEATLKLGGSSPQDGKGKPGGNASGGGAMMSGRPGMRMPFRAMGRMGAAGDASDANAPSGGEPKLTGLQLARARQEKRRMEMEAEAAQRRQAAELAQKEREQEAEERKAQRAQLAQIQEELRRQREERLAEEARRAAAGEVEQP